MYQSCHVAALLALWEYEPWGKNDPLVDSLQMAVRGGKTKPPDLFIGRLLSEITESKDTK